MNAIPRPASDFDAGSGLSAACPAHRPVRSPLARAALVALGAVAFALGALGLFVPLLPTFVFWLFAAWAWARAWPALAARLLRHPGLGPTLHAFLCHGVVARPAKRAAIGGMTLSLALSALFIAPPPPVLLALAAGWVLACGWLATRPERPAGTMRVVI